MDDPKDKIVDIARRLSRRMDSFSPQGEMGDLHRELKDAFVTLDADYPFRCQLCRASFMTKPELDAHSYSSEHIGRLGRPSPVSGCC